VWKGFRGKEQDEHSVRLSHVDGGRRDSERDERYANGTGA
jgi:hypothetical protein